jgi:hypothetical protein
VRASQAQYILHGDSPLPWAKLKNQKIIHDPDLFWLTKQITSKYHVLKRKLQQEESQEGQDATEMMDEDDAIPEQQLAASTSSDAPLPRKKRRTPAEEETALDTSEMQLPVLQKANKSSSRAPVKHHPMVENFFTDWMAKRNDVKNLLKESQGLTRSLEFQLAKALHMSKSTPSKNSLSLRWSLRKRSASSTCNNKNGHRKRRRRECVRRYPQRELNV